MERQENRPNRLKMVTNSTTVGVRYHLPMPSGKTRCDWSLKGNDAYIRYHDEEWGVPLRNDRGQFEFLTLESAQAGLSWSTILNKRDGYRKNFADFDPEKVARFTDRKIEKMLLDPSIVRNRAKVKAAVSNAKEFLRIVDELGSFTDYIWGFVDGEPVVNRWKKQSDVPATSRESDALSDDLRKRGFKFVGSTVMYAHMQATGLVNDHIVGCFRHREVGA